jgi:hypothetical protein
MLVDSSPVGRNRSAHRQGPRLGQRPPPYPRVHRIPQASQYRLPSRHGDQGDPGHRSAHISRETQAWLATQPAGRFAFTSTPKHGSWLNLIEGFFSKFARLVLRHIRVASKQELKERIMLGIKDVNRHPVIHTWYSAIRRFLIVTSIWLRQEEQRAP